MSGVNWIQPTNSAFWSSESLGAAALTLALGHASNEARHEPACPLALESVWALWDPSQGAPRAIDLALSFAPRPLGLSPLERRLPQEQQRARTLDFWRACLIRAGWAPGRIARMLAPSWSQHQRQGARRALIYQDSRCGAPIESAETSLRKAALWRERRATLRAAPGESASLFADIGKTLAASALTCEGGELPIASLAPSREVGQRLAEQALREGAFWVHDPERRAFDYDLACREAGEEASGAPSARHAQELIEAFFWRFASDTLWPTLAGSGEQEVYFPMLCQIEPQARALAGLL